MSLERRVLTECLKLYKDFPCLWDNRLFLYTNKEARDQAYEVLLENYRQLQEDAALVELKRKIENMRTSYRRERKKVLLSRMKNDPVEYSPQLWYYNLMSFLDDVMDFSNLELQTQDNGELINDTSMKIEFDDDTSSSLKRVLLQTPQLRVKKKRNASAIYLEDQPYSDDNVDHEVEEIQIEQINEQNGHNNVETHYSVSEAEAFGTTVGLQLKELDLMQKIYAEKLISDVIYNGRLGRLTFNSNLNIE